ncbi:MAG: putative oxidoreductase [Myxococcaceae bacterium]|nr:putative oxidoreductase [Myxococcaceae bacterium]
MSRAHKTAPTMNRPGARVTRRKVLKLSLAGFAAAALGGFALAAQKTRLLADTPKLQVLDGAEYAILVALAERLCPAAGDGAPGATKLRIAEYFDDVLGQSDAEAQKALKGALALFENALGGALVGERLVPFTELSADDQDRVLHGWQDSKLGVRRTVFRALASGIQSFYWGNPATWKRIGYEQPDPAALRLAYADNLVDLDALRATPLANGT